MDPASMSFAGMNWLGMGLAILANIVIGFIWYANWFPTGKVWARSMGMDPKNMPKMQGGKMAMSMILMIIGAFLMFFVFTHTFWVYQDADRNVATGGTADYKLTVMDGLMGG